MAREKRYPSTERGKADGLYPYDQESSPKDDDYRSDYSVSDDEDQGCRPDTVDRQCTDFGWLFPFFFGVLAVSWVVQYSVSNGDLKRFRTFKDLRGEFCFDRDGQQYLYFCENHPGQLNVTNPICVSACPNDTMIEHSFACEAYGFYKNTTDYSTEPYFGMMCKPMQMKLRDQVNDYLIQTRHSVVKRLLLRSPETIVACVFLAVITSSAYLVFLGRCAHVVVYTGLVIAIMVPLGFGFYLMGWTTWVGMVPRPYQLVGNLDANPVIGAGLLFLGTSCACCFMRMSVNVDKAMQCLEDAIECCMDTPTLQWQPVIHLVVMIGSAFMPVAGIVMLLSCQDISLAYQDSGPLVHLMLLTKKQCLYLVVLVSMGLWIQQTNLMASTFVITYIAQLWYYNGGDEGEGFVPHGAIAKAYWVCYRYHFGTLLKGSLAVGITWPVRNIMGLVVGFTEMKANAVGTLVSAACCFCIACFERWFEHQQKGVFFEVALNAKPWCVAAKAHIRVTDTEADTKRILHGASRVFQLAGLMITSLVGALAMCLMRQREGGFDVDTNRQLILAQLTFLILGSVVACIVSFPFMMLFHTVADTILYIRTVEQLRSATEKTWSWSPTVLQCVCCKRMRPEYPYGDSEEGLADGRPQLPDKRGSKSLGRNQRR